MQEDGQNPVDRSPTNPRERRFRCRVCSGQGKVQEELQSLCRKGAPMKITAALMYLTTHPRRQP